MPNWHLKLGLSWLELKSDEGGGQPLVDIFTFETVGSATCDHANFYLLAGAMLKKVGEEGPHMSQGV